MAVVAVMVVAVVEQGNVSSLAFKRKSGEEHVFIPKTHTGLLND